MTRLDTPRLHLRPVTPTDIGPLWSLWTDPDVRRFLWDDREITRDEAAATVHDCLALAAKGLGLWMLEFRTDGSFVGCTGLLPATVAAEYDARLAGLNEPLVALAPAVWGHGYAHEALCALLAHAEQTLGLTALAGVTDVPNEASDRMLRRAGFRVLGEVPGPRYRLRTYRWESAIRVTPNDDRRPAPDAVPS